MDDLNDLPDSPDKIVNLPHLFELDLHHTAVVNLGLTLEGITRLEQELIEESKGEDEETTSAINGQD